MAVLNFIQQVLSTPAIFVGLLALLGLALQKKDAQTMIKGTIKTILGFIVLNAGASVVQQAIIPFGDLFQLAFGAVSYTHLDVYKRKVFLSAPPGTGTTTLVQFMEYLSEQEVDAEPIQAIGLD